VHYDIELNSAAHYPAAGIVELAPLIEAAGFGAFLVIALISPAGMGMGDVKLAGLLGIGLGYLGWGHVFVGFFLGFVAGSVVSLVLVAARRAETLSPITSIASGGGPIQPIPASAHARAKCSFSARKPYPGWIAFALAFRAVAISFSMLR
jgi:hypothetical protein